MTAPPLSPTDRFVDPGSSRIYWVTPIAVPAAPTRSELDAGIDVTGEVAEIQGFALVSETNSTQAFGQVFATEKPGGLKGTGQPRMVLYADEGGHDIRRVWSRNDTGHVVLLHGGDIAGHLMDVWPATIAAISKTFSTVDAAFVAVQFTIHDDPVTDVEVP